jgi:hypothetical protein
MIYFITYKQFPCSSGIEQKRNLTAVSFSAVSPVTVPAASTPRNQVTGQKRKSGISA